MTHDPTHLVAAMIVSTFVLTACGDDTSETTGDSALSHMLAVAREGSLVSYDIESGEERPGTVQNVDSPVDLQALSDGTLLVNLTTRNEVLIVDGRTMLQIDRIPSSSAKGARPVHSYLSPERGNRRYWLTLNDGEAGKADTNSAIFIDVADDSKTRFQAVGEVSLGIGHHKASFSTEKDRVVITNIADCDNVMTVYDYSNMKEIEPLATFSGEDAGFTAEDPGEGAFDPAYCDPTYQRGLPPAPHGCATSAVSKKAYCSVTNSGDSIAVDLDAEKPSFKRIETGGSGGGFTLVHEDGRYVYVMQESPREGAMFEPGVDCQVGQVVVIDAQNDEVVAEVPALYEGPKCKRSLVGTAAESANLGHAYFTPDGKTLFVPTSGGFQDDDARVEQLLVFDTSDPARPEQLASIGVGVHTGHSAAALTGDGRFLFVVHGVDGTVSQIDVDTFEVVRVFEVGENPKVVSTFGTKEGPAEATGPIAKP